MGSRLQLDERREQLLELGLRLFSTRSYDDISITEIAKQAGISKGLLYHYFGGKRDFYTATIQFAANHLLAALLPRDDDRPGAEKALSGLQAYFDFVEAHAEAYAALMHGGLGKDPTIQVIIESTRAAITTRILTGLGLTEDRPIFRLAARSWLGAVEATSLQWLARRDVTRPKLIALLQSNLYFTMLTATHLDPDAGVVLDPLPSGGFWSG